jgi:hypothetical protein
MGLPAYLTDQTIEELRAENAELKRRVFVAEQRLESLELVVVCARDIADRWFTMTIRTISNMTNRVDTLRQALEAAGK